jgi:hypothetical protein
VPLYEGKMVQAFDHRAASVIVNRDNLHRPAQPSPAPWDQSEDPSWTPAPQFWVAEELVLWPEGLEWTIGFKDVTSPTNARTMIAAMMPKAAAGNTLPLLFPEISDRPDMSAGDEDWVIWHRDIAEVVGLFKLYSVILLANLNSIVLDYAARQKVQGQHLNWFIVEQLPILPELAYGQEIGCTTAREIVRDEVLRLTYVSQDMAPFAHDMGYDGPPFRWDEEERRHSCARLDALYFLLYGLDRNDADYVLDTFPIVREQDEREFGSYRTKDLILGYMAAFAAGDAESRIRA